MPLFLSIGSVSLPESWSSSILCKSPITHVVLKARRQKCKESYSIHESNYRIVASTSPSRIEAHAGLFRLLMKGIFDPYVLWPFDKELIFLLVMLVSTREFTVNEKTQSDFFHHCNCNCICKAILINRFLFEYKKP